MKQRTFGATGVTVLVLLHLAVPRYLPAQTEISTILFGSCLDQDRAARTLEMAVNRQPDLFLFLGDNVYADTTNPAIMGARYEKLAEREDFQQLLEICPVMATWDDHDYGRNDAGASFVAKEMAEARFLDFWQRPSEAPERRREGIYRAQSFGPPGRTVQVIMLDTRYFRDDLMWRGRSGGAGPYAPHEDSEKTILGEAQWSWLKERLEEPADLRILATSIQFAAAHHGWESWANFPDEQRRLIDLIRETRAQGVIFVSGDRHMAELSRLDADAALAPPYPLLDLTSSGLNRRFPAASAGPNENRVGGAYLKVNFGELSFDWEAQTLRLQIRDSGGEVVLSQSIGLDELRPEGTGRGGW